MADGPVYLVGAPRSGTSLAYKALCLHPQVAWLSNLGRATGWRPAACALNRLAAQAPAQRRRVWFSGGDNAYVYGRARRWHERGFPMPVEAQPLFDAVLGPPGAVAGPAAHRRLAEVLEQSRRWAGGTVLVNKNVANNRRIAELAATDPDARFVHLVRDGRSVARSLRAVDWWERHELWWFGGSVRRWLDEGRDPWEACVRTWVAELTEVEHGLDDVAPERVRTVRYEDLIAEPVGTLDELIAFAGLTPTGAFAAEVGRLSFPDRDDRWRAELTDDEIAALHALAGPTLERLGYGP